MAALRREPGERAAVFLLAIEKEHFSLWQLCDGNLERGLLYWGP
jgi:hypothetical protein